MPVAQLNFQSEPAKSSILGLKQDESKMKIVFNPIKLCSRCLVNEISNWTYENQLCFDEDTMKQIREEMKDIKLVEGECIVCKNKRIEEGCFENILSILEKSKTNSEKISEFRKLFGLEV